VVDSLSHELPNIRTFATLSPIPGFRAWLEDKLSEGEPNFLTLAEHEQLRATGYKGGKGSLKALLETSDWQSDRRITAVLEKPLTRLCARYLIQEKQDGQPIDPVARFHLSNGAQVERLNWLGDTSSSGFSRSVGLMVNYLYRLKDIEKNHEAFTGQGRVITSLAVRSLVTN
jgi:malonyl-CoA decarboxylase